MKKIYEEVPRIQLSGNAMDYTDTVLGKLTVRYPIEREQYINSQGRQDSHVRWLAECECGTQVSIRAHQISANRVRSCGRCQVEHAKTTERMLELPYHLAEDTSESVDAETEEIFNLIEDVTSEPNLTDHQLTELEGLDKLLNTFSVLDEECRQRVYDYVGAKFNLNKAESDRQEVSV